MKQENKKYLTGTLEMRLVGGPGSGKTYLIETVLKPALKKASIKFVDHEGAYNAADKERYLKMGFDVVITEGK